MLKALELHGFKSFADRARFEFPAGITVVVGPNGSGKSNIVDALKWVLGEQSAKSLRGKEMSDVIFKGSGASGRKPMNTAEATVVFDNTEGRLPIDAPEVHITRRVYRSGEGEYLINRQPARLKDIRDLLRGTGVGVDAYSLIEQGKVDKLLQASAKDRRAMFEEAAGISRFKAKKVEAQRRLERVEQNMLRLNDIVEEVENRLKTVRNQAGKARRYREHTERLQQLRTQIALVDWRKLSEQLAGIESQLAAVHEQIAAADADAQRLEARQLELETAALTASEELRNCETQRSFARQQLAQQQAAIHHERSRSAELEEEIIAHGRHLLAMSSKAVDARAQLRALQGEVDNAKSAQQAAATSLAGREAQLTELSREYDSVRDQSESRRQRYVTQLQLAASLASQVEAGESRLAARQEAVMQHQRKLADLAAEEGQLAEQLAASEERARLLGEQLAAHAEEAKAAQEELAENRNLHATRADDLAQLTSRQRGLAERAQVLEEFERTLEGLGSGVKQVLARAGVHRRKEVGNQRSEIEEGSAFKVQGSNYPWSLVRGVVADFVQVSVEHAAAIDAALGEMAQAVIVAGARDQTRELVSAASDVSGRVMVIAVPSTTSPGLSASGLSPASPLPGTESSVLSTQYTAAGSDPDPDRAPSPSRPSLPPIELTADMVAGVGVIARADKLVECPEEYRPLIAELLGRTFVVRSLDDAFALQQKAPRGTRLVTLTGDLVDELGAVTFGPRQSATSLVSRRSQLRAARLDLAVLDQQIIDAERETAHLKREIERHEAAVRQLPEAGKTLDQQAGGAAASIESLSQRVQQARQQRTSAAQSVAEAEAACQSIEMALKTASRDLAEAQQAAEAMQREIASHERAIAQLEAKRSEATAIVTTAKIELARCEQRLESLLQRLAQFEDDHRDRERALVQVGQQLRQAHERQETSQLAMLGAEAAIAGLALHEETLRRQMRGCMADRDAAAAERAAQAEELAAVRRRAMKLRDQEHQSSLAAEQVRHQRQALADRLREDYGIELAEQMHEPSPAEAGQRTAVEEEIESLRRKINQIGAVNLDALEELDELEQRFGTLSAQHKDLTEAKQSLERIIHKINADSRRLFLETLEAIRVNFQALYRKAFGGGKADIVLEEGVDVLECGVEIIATPPGKPSFNNSLLSGGEKALTAVALLLAIFQFRPSPFCVLDEVDAPFDEANIGRFIDVLKDFLVWTRFVIVTHSKKTMTAATTLYGVTMQESGVSKRVSVRFEDVSDDGQISRDAVSRSLGEAAENAA
jgi:chromosome segregation protein